MNALLSTLSRPLRWLHRLPHRRGYGIHSPFAFDLVTGVIYEHTPYYFYEHFDKGWPTLPRSGTLRRKDYHLLFRLANYQRAARCRLIDISLADPVAICLHAGRRAMRFVDEDDPCELIVVRGADGLSPTLLDGLQPGGLLIWIGIGATRATRRGWQHLLGDPRVQVSFDLHDMGLAFYRPELQRQDYVINYY